MHGVVAGDVQTAACEIQDIMESPRLNWIEINCFCLGVYPPPPWVCRWRGFLEERAAAHHPHDLLQAVLPDEHAGGEALRGAGGGAVAHEALGNAAQQAQPAVAVRAVQDLVPQQRLAQEEALRVVRDHDRRLLLPLQKQPLQSARW